MSRFFPTICLPLGLLLAFAGCVGVESEPQTSRPEFVEPAEAAPAEQIQELAEPQESQIQASAMPEPGTGQTDTKGSAPDTGVVTEAVAPPPATEVSQDAEAGEPNAATPADPAPEGEATAIVPLEATVAVEANEAGKPVPPAPQAQAQATAEALPQQPQSDDATPNALTSFYQGYADILQEYVLEDGRVDYDSLRRKRLRLKHLLNEPDELDPNVYQGWPEEEKLALWINTYNLKMLEVIVRNYPIQSSWWLRLTWPPSDIRHIDGIWSHYRFIVMDEEFTLGEVERRLFRQTFGDPRAYLALTYTTRSGPSLRRRPYQGLELDRQLDEQVKAFLASDRGFRIDRDEGVVFLSALFKPSWRGKEFIGRYGTQKKFKNHPPETRAVLNFLTRYISEDDVYFLEVENYTLAYMNFDWRLSDRGRGY